MFPGDPFVKGYPVALSRGRCKGGKFGHKGNVCTKDTGTGAPFLSFFFLAPPCAPFCDTLCCQQAQTYKPKWPWTEIMNQK